MNERTADPEGRILTVPNLLSAFRLCLIFPIIRLYCVGQWGAAAGVLVLSGVTDIADGFLARRFSMTSRLGTVLDPVADKLTQACILFCLCARHPAMKLPLLLMVAKETCMTVSGWRIYRATGTVPGALWHGKTATVMLYAMSAAHMVLPGISDPVSNLMAALCAGMIAVSFVLYGIRNIRVLRDAAIQ